MNKLTANSIRAMGFRAVLTTYHRWRYLVAFRLMKEFDFDTQMPVWCSARLDRHYRPLERLGFVVTKEFTLTHRLVSDPQSYRSFRHLMRARFPDGFWKCVANGRHIVMTVPPAQIPDWERFFSEYDTEVA